MGQYIPDITERFPEGYGGIDMTPSYFGEPVDWSQAYDAGDSYEGYEEDGEIPFTEESSGKFDLDQEYSQVGIYGGVTVYKVEAIDRENSKILLAEVWYDVDGTGTRPAKWHDLAVDKNGKEKALEWASETYGEFWIYA